MAKAKTTYTKITVKGGGMKLTFQPLNIKIKKGR